MKLLVDPNSFAEDGSPPELREMIALSVSTSICLGDPMTDVIERLQKDGAVKTTEWMVLTGR
jgi:hypothetical protein